MALVYILCKYTELWIQNSNSKIQLDKQKQDVIRFEINEYDVYYNYHKCFVKYFICILPRSLSLAPAIM